MPPYPDRLLTLPDHPRFSDLGLCAALAQAASGAGWLAPTPVQLAAVPAVLQGRDLLAIAPTGSGKTAAFALPLLQAVLQDPDWQDERPRRLRALVLAPTRELAAKTAGVIDSLARSTAPGLKCVLAVGGLSINPQMMALRGGAQVVVATPGRLLDLLDHNALRLDGLPLLVLDEADKLLDLGFADEVGRLLAHLGPAAGGASSSADSSATSPARQTLLFSATMPAAVATLAGQLLHSPLQVDISGPAAAAPDIQQRAIVVDTPRRTALLRHLIQTAGWDRVLVFVATQYASEHVADKLSRAGIKAAALHGQQSMGRRSQMLADLRAGRLQALVATDLAARGIDVAGLAAVVNHDLPRAAVDYTHRIGRTGRAGLTGQAVSFICADAPGSEPHFRLIEKRQGQRVPREQVAGFEPAAAPPVLAEDTAAGAAPQAGDPHGDPNVDQNGGIKGRRKSKKDKLREAAAHAAAAATRPARNRR